MEKTISMSDVINMLNKIINEVNTFETISARKHDKFYSFYFKVKKSDDKILSIEVYENYFSVYCNNYSVDFKHKLSDRDRLTLDRIVLDIKDINEDRLVKSFINFIPTTIHDLYNE